MSAPTVRAGFTASREDVLATLYLMGSTCCSYSLGGEWADRCDCKYGVKAGRWPTAGEGGNGCPELRSLYVIVAALSDEEWGRLMLRAGGVPSGLFGGVDLTSRIARARAEVEQAVASIERVREELSDA